MSNKRSDHADDASSGGAPDLRLWHLWRSGQRPDLRKFLTEIGELKPVQLLAAMRVDQHHRWHCGERIPAETYLEWCPTLATQPESALELVYSEFLLREELGESPALADYAKRFPQYAERLKLQIDLHRAMESACHEERQGGPVSFWDPPLEKLVGDSNSGQDLPPSDSGVPGYQILGVLGRGGMGVVYKARQLGLNRVVALKMVLFGGHAAPEQLHRFRTEAEAAARLHHPNIVEIYTVGEQAGWPYLAMEYVDGGTVAQRLDGTPQPARAAAKLVETLARAIQFAHERGVLHRDLKPANVLMQTVAGQAAMVVGLNAEQSCAVAPAHAPLSTHIPKITDFGLAKILDAGGSVTQTGAILGTPSYMAPEQAGNNSNVVGPATDIYSLGTILYELLTGRPPFKAQTPIDTLQQVLCDEPVSVSRLQPTVPRDLETICLKCLEKEPQRRYLRASDLADDLDRFLRDRPIEARRAGPAERAWRWCRRNKALASLAASITLLLAASAIGASLAAGLWRNQRDQAILARNRIADAERQTTDKLWDSLLATAQSVRRTNTVGRRFEGLRYIREAAAIRPDPRLRTEAIACLALPDLRPMGAWHDTGTVAGYGVAVDAALERYAANDLNGHVVVRRLDDNRELHRFDDPPGGRFWYFWAAFSHDGRYLMAVYLVGSSEQRWTVWDLEHETRTVDSARTLAWTSNSQLLAVENDGTPMFIDPRTGLEQSRLDSTKLVGASRLRVNSTEQQVAMIGDNTREVSVVDLRSGQIRHRFLQPARADDSAWRADSQVLAVACQDHRVYLYDTVAGRLKAILDGHRGVVTDVQFSPNGQLLMTNSWDGTTRFWDAVSGRALFEVPGRGLGFSSDGNRVALCRGEQISVWELSDRRECRLLHHGQVGNRSDWLGFGGPVSVSFSNDGQLLASASGDGVRLFEVVSALELGHLPIDACHEVLFHRETKALITYGRIGLYRWPLRPDGGADGLIVGPPQQLHLPDLPSADSFRASWGANGQTLAIVQRGDGQGNGRVILKSLDESPPGRLEVGQQVLWAALSPNGRWAAAGIAYDRNVIVWNTSTGQELRRLPASLDQRSQNGAVAFSPDGRWLAVGGQSEYILWDTDTWEAGPVFRREQHEPWPHPPAFSPDGRLAALDTSPERIVLIDPSIGMELVSLTPPDPQTISHMTFNADASQLAVARHNHTIELWDLRMLRDELAAIGLDWSESAYAANVPQLQQQPSRLVIELGDQSPDKRWARRYEQLAAQSRKALDANPNDAVALNNLAWSYVAGPPESRNPHEAVTLAERSVELQSGAWFNQHTLGVVYFRLGEDSRSIETFQRAIQSNRDEPTAFDLFFLAMCHHRLGESAKARNAYDAALQWLSRRSHLSPSETAELRAFQTEADQLLGR